MRDRPRQRFGAIGSTTGARRRLKPTSHEARSPGERRDRTPGRGSSNHLSCWPRTRPATALLKLTRPPPRGVYYKPRVDKEQAAPATATGCLLSRSGAICNEHSSNTASGRQWPPRRFLDIFGEGNFTSSADQASPQRLATMCAPHQPAQRHRWRTTIATISQGDAFAHSAALNRHAEDLLGQDRNTPRTTST